MMTTNPYDAATSAYGMAQSRSMSKIDILLSLYRGLLRYIDLATEAHQRKNNGEVVGYVDKAISVLIALQSSIDHDIGGKYARDLDTFYTGAYIRLRRAASVGGDTETELRYVYKNVRDIYNHWHRLSSQHPELFSSLNQ